MDIQFIATLSTIAIGVFSILGVTIGLFLYLATKIDNLASDMKKDMQDFHGRLVSIEERIKGK